VTDRAASFPAPKHSLLGIRTRTLGTGGRDSRAVSGAGGPFGSLAISRGSRGVLIWYGNHVGSGDLNNGTGRGETQPIAVAETVGTTGALAVVDALHQLDAPVPVGDVTGLVEPVAASVVPKTS